MSPPVPAGVQLGFMNPSQPFLAPPAPAFPHQTVHWNGNEPYLQAREDLRLTPFRPSDAPALASLLGHPDVGRYSYDRPYPYTLTAAEAKIAAAMPDAEALAMLRADGVLDTSPFTAIRYRPAPKSANGTETETSADPDADAEGYVFVGDMNVWLRGDGRGILGLAYDVHPAWARRGIGRAAVSCVLGWAARAMDCDKIEAYTETINAASAGLLQNLAFGDIATINAPWPEISGGGTRDLHVWQRRLPAPDVWVAVPAPAPSLPVQWDGAEPFLDLGDVRLTPYRDTQDEIDDLMALSNHPTVAAWTYTRPTPFLESHARARLDANLEKQAGAIDALRAGRRVEWLPFTVIRQDGRLVGDIALYPAICAGVPGVEMSYTLHPGLHGRGIGYRAASAVLGFYPAMGGGRMMAYTQKKNLASSRVLEKLGYVVAEEMPKRWKDGGWREVWLWNREVPGAVPSESKE